MSALPIVALFGPTGVGKTAVAIALAGALEADAPVAVSADALQVYAGLEILTGAASASERARLEHRMVGVADVTETFSAGRYAALAHAEIDGLITAGRRPIVVGGTGLYLRAALADLDLRPPPDPVLRAHWLGELERSGPAALHAELVRRQPATTVPATDGHRLVRALELLDAGHAPPERSEDSQLWTVQTRHPTHLAALTMERTALYEQINARVDAMVAAGAADEVRAADAAGASATARKALGFEHLLAGDVEGMKQATRRYARRQLTWLRKLPGVQHIDVTGRSAGDVAAEIAGALR